MGAGQSLPKITAQDKAILDMKLQRDKLKQYQKRIEFVRDREQAIAKEHLAAGRKDRALIALRRRKYQEGLLAKTDSQLENLEQLVNTVEFSLVEVSVMHGLKQGNDVLKEIHKEMNVESVEKLMEETAEARAYQQEISDMLANTLSLDDEDTVQDELAQLIAEQTKQPEQNISLPDAPGHVPVPEPEPEQPQHVEAEQDRERVPVLA
ncbi:unnamed protein product [Peniophora sp. CBMAI 1063]|nr:unnamed protein product [Peniophora sp. CBMAI 1063]